MAPTIQEFLDSKGGVGLLAVLNERGKTYTEIESEVAISSDTISKRKDEALEIGLIEMKPAKRRNRTVTEYHLTDFGEELVRQMALKGIVSNYLSMRTHQRKVDEKREELIDWVYQNPSQFMEFVEAREETLIDREDEDMDGSEDAPETDDLGRTETWGDTEGSDDEEDVSDLFEDSDDGEDETE